MSNPTMDFHAMKRKELQALCKKHKIPANLTNLEMANRLASLLEVEEEQPRKKLGKSCLKSLDDLGTVDESTGDVKVAKKVRFSPEDQTFEFEKTNPRAVRLAARRRKSLLMDEEKIQDEENVLPLEDAGNSLQKVSEKAAADKRVKSTRTRGRGKKTDQADAAEAELLQAEEKGCRKTSRKRVSCLVDSGVFIEEPGNLPQKASEKVVGNKRVRSTRSGGRGKKTEQVDAAEAELLQAEENHGCEKTSQKRISSSAGSEVPSLMDEGETKAVLRRSSRNAGRPDEFASLAKDVYIAGSPKRKTRSDCPPKKQDAEKTPKRCLGSNRLKETHEDAVDEAKEEGNETARTTHNTRQKKRARGLNETVSTESDSVAEPPRRRRSTRASTRKGLGAHGKVDGNEILDKSDAKIQEVGILSSGEKLREKENASQPVMSDEPSMCDGTGNSSAAIGADDVQTDVAGGTPLAKSASNAEDDQNLLYPSSNATEDYQGKNQPSSQTAPTPLLEECEFKNVNEGSCKTKTGLKDLAEASMSKGKTQLENKGKAVSTRGKQQGHSPFISGKEGILVDFYRSDNQNMEDDYKEEDANKQVESDQAESINRDTSEDAKNVLLPTIGLESSPKSVASKIPAEDNNAELENPVLEANSHVQRDPSLTSNSIDECAGPLSFQGTSHAQHEAASPIYALEESELNNAAGEASVSKNIEQGDHALVSTTIKFDDQCQSTSKCRTVDTLTGTAKEMQDGDEPIISSEEGITVGLYNLENQITKYFETARSDSFPALLEFQTRLEQPTEVSAASPLMSNEPLHSQVDRCPDHLVAHECSKVESKEAVEVFIPSEMLGENSEGADKLDNSTMLDQSPKQGLGMNGSMAVDTVECKKKALEGFSPVGTLDEASEGAEKSVNGNLDEKNMEFKGSPEHGQAMKSHIAGDTAKSIEKEVEGLLPTEMLYQSPEDVDRLKSINDRLDEDIESDGSPKEEPAMKNNTAGEVVEPTENAAEEFTAAQMPYERVDENTESDGIPEQKLALKSDTVGDAAESTENAVEGISPTEMQNENMEGAERIFCEREDESTESHGSPEQELAMKSGVAGDAVESTENGVEGFIPTEMLNEKSEGAEKFIGVRVDESSEPDGGSPKQELDKKRHVAEEAVEGFTRFHVLNENSEGAQKFVCDKPDETTESNGCPNHGLAMKSDLQLSVHEGTSSNDPEERVELCLTEEDVRRPEVVHGDESAVVSSDLEGRHMTEFSLEDAVLGDKYIGISGDEGEGHKEKAEKGEWLYDAEICMEEADLAGKTDDLTSNDLGCSDIGGDFTAKVHKVSPNSSRFSDKMELVAGSKERRKLICADYLDFKSPGPQSAINLGDGAFRDEAGENASSAMCNGFAEENMVNLEHAADQQISMHICGYRDNSASNVQASFKGEYNVQNDADTPKVHSFGPHQLDNADACLVEDNMTAASEATDDQVPLDCFSSEPEPAHANYENVKFTEDGPTVELNVQSPESLCPVEELHSAEHTRLEDFLGHGFLEEVPERTGGHGHVVSETAFSSYESKLSDGENSVTMEAEETGEKQYKEAEGLTPAARVEETYEGLDSVASEKRNDTAESERSHKQGPVNENNPQLTRNEGADCDIDMKNLEMYPTEEVMPENSDGRDFELTGYETALFMGDEFDDEAGEPDFGTSERCWWISSRNDNSKKEGENGMEQAVGDHISKQGCEGVVHFEHCNAFEEETGKVDCGMKDENDSTNQQAKNEDVVHSERCNAFEEDIGRGECVMKDENHSMDQAEKDMLNDLMREDEMHLCSMDDDTLEGGGNKDIEDQVTAAYSEMFSMMPDEMFMTADVEGAPGIANHTAENMQSDDMGVTAQVFASSPGSSRPGEEKLREGTLAEENVDGNGNRGKGTFELGINDDTFRYEAENLNHATTPTGSVDNLEDETASLDQPIARIIQESQEERALVSSVEDNRLAIENQKSCDGESGARLTIPHPETNAPEINDQYETSDEKDSVGIFKKDEVMPQQGIKPLNEETKDARRQEMNMSYREPASLMNHKKRSILIHGTPKRPVITSDMKENSTAHRKELVPDATAQRPLARRKALGELPRV